MASRANGPSTLVSPVQKYRSFIIVVMVQVIRIGAPATNVVPKILWALCSQACLVSSVQRDRRVCPGKKVSLSLYKLHRVERHPWICLDHLISSWEDGLRCLPIRHSAYNIRDISTEAEKPWLQPPAVTSLAFPKCSPPGTPHPLL